MYSNNFGGIYMLNVTTGITKPALPGSSMDLNNVTITAMGSGTHTLQIMFSETGYTTPGGAGGSFGGTLSNFLTGLPSSGSVSATAYFSNTNTLFAQSNLIGTSGTIPATGAFSSNFGGTGPTAGPFSLTQVLYLTTSGPGVAFSGDFSLAVNPEPPGYVLMSSVLLFAAAAFRLRARRS
jgi:hypothetical protein